MWRPRKRRAGKPATTCNLLPGTYFAADRGQAASALLGREVPHEEIAAILERRAEGAAEAGDASRLEEVMSAYLIPWAEGEISDANPTGDRQILPWGFNPGDTWNIVEIDGATYEKARPPQIPAGVPRDYKTVIVGYDSKGQNKRAYYAAPNRSLPGPCYI